MMEPICGWRRNEREMVVVVESTDTDRTYPDGRFTAYLFHQERLIGSLGYSLTAGLAITKAEARWGPSLRPGRKGGTSG